MIFHRYLKKIFFRKKNFKRFVSRFIFPSLTFWGFDPIGFARFSDYSMKKSGYFFYLVVYFLLIFSGVFFSVAQKKTFIDYLFNFSSSKLYACRCYYYNVTRSQLTFPIPRHFKKHNFIQVVFIIPLCI